MGKKAVLLTALLTTSLSFAAPSPQPVPPGDEIHPIKYSIYSPAWGENMIAGLRVVAENRTEHPVELESLALVDEANAGGDLATLDLNLDIPARGWAEAELAYVDLLSGNECISKTMASDWKLVEISNYTLNPSVRRLIIEDTDSFRIYQCVRNVRTTWSDLVTDEQHQYTEWVMYHFERRGAFGN